ncbi:ABC transporter permease [Asticcacaulis sp. AC460]|uniref:sulfate ABC transporter substrate-binding protein n=1 Tax=Asticcacaulis sp. AC460 TaxID=1282360 RepID=UPI0003C3C332|nr:sulfate ABC transporter substrate-binding protein [Asticcacaulis sp. AC460]ESQ87471.1 ABC transporter permease [Asticcacaulis sp. AC460]
MDRRQLLTGSLFGATLALTGSGCAPKPATGAVELLNVSYDPTRELYAQYNELFARFWKDTTGQDVTIRQSHGGSGAQARSVIDGVQADVVTLALSHDIDSIARKTGLIATDWQKRLPNNASPYTSTIVFLVRKGNPKAIKDWGDLIKPGVQVITPNPKTGGGARWNYLAALGWALKHYGGDEAKAHDYLKALFNNVPVLDSGARGSTVTFVERQVGDVLLAWENEAWLSIEKLGQGQYEIVLPSLSILAEPPVAVVDKVADKKGTAKVAKAYLEHLYSPQAQDIIARNHYRPSDPQVAAQNADRFPRIPTVTIADFGGWDAVQTRHFEYGGVFDQITTKPAS